MSGILKSPNTWVLVVPVSFEIRARRQYSERARSNRASSDVQCASCFTESTSDEYTNTLACTLAPDTTVTLNKNHSLSPSFSLFECINIPKSHHFVISFMLVVNWCHLDQSQLQTSYSCCAIVVVDKLRGYCLRRRLR